METEHKGNPHRSPPFDPGGYWDRLSDRYQGQTRISTDDIHYGPLAPGDRELGLFGEVAGRDFLELGCGAGQNSIVLARRGARVVGLDISPRQIGHARSLARRERVEAEFRVVDIETGLANIPDRSFDGVHSAWGTSFVADPGPVLAQCRRILRPGGRLILSTGHPVFAGDWIEIDDGAEGIFLTNYFEPPADVRSEDGAMVAAFFHPIGWMLDRIEEAGLRFERLVEPRAAPGAADGPDATPYWSESWAQMAPQLASVPVVVIYVARCPAGG